MVWHLTDMSSAAVYFVPKYAIYWKCKKFLLPICIFIQIGPVVFSLVVSTMQMHGQDQQTLWYLVILIQLAYLGSSLLKSEIFLALVTDLGGSKKRVLKNCWL